MNAFSLSDPDDGDGQTGGVPVGGGLSLLLAAARLMGERRSLQLTEGNDGRVTVVH